MGALGTRLETDRRHPVADNTCILACRDGQAFMKSAGPKVLRTDHQLIFHPLLNRGSCAFGYLKAHGFLRLALKDRSPFLDLTRRHYIYDLHLHQAAAAQLAIDCHVEQREIAMVLSQFKPHSDRPDVLWFQRSLRPTIRPLFQAGRRARMAGRFGVSITDPQIRHALPKRQLDVDRSILSQHAALPLMSTTSPLQKCPSFAASARGTKTCCTAAGSLLR